MTFFSTTSLLVKQTQIQSAKSVHKKMSSAEDTLHHSPLKLAAQRIYGSKRNSLSFQEALRTSADSVESFASSPTEQRSERPDSAPREATYDHPPLAVPTPVPSPSRHYAADHDALHYNSPVYRKSDEQNFVRSGAMMDEQMRKKVDQTNAHVKVLQQQLNDMLVVLAKMVHNDAAKSAGLTEKETYNSRRESFPLESRDDSQVTKQDTPTINAAPPSSAAPTLSDESCDKPDRDTRCTQFWAFAFFAGVFLYGLIGIIRWICNAIVDSISNRVLQKQIKDNQEIAQLSTDSEASATSIRSTQRV